MGDRVGGHVLCWREASTMASTWDEALCLESLGGGAWRLVVAAEELDLVDERIPFDQEPDENGEYPEQLTHLGRPVRAGDGWWEYADGRGCLVQQDDSRCWIIAPGDYETALALLREDGWDRSAAWQAVRARIAIALGVAG